MTVKSPHRRVAVDEPLTLSYHIFAEEEEGISTEVLMLGYAQTATLAVGHGSIYSYVAVFDVSQLV